MKSILDTCTPRADILTGAFNPEIFTASLSQVMDHYRGQGAGLHTLYTDADSFFREATYPTYGMKAVISEVMARLAGDVTVPAIHRLETAFGGGKTHTLIALVHLAYGGRAWGEVARNLFEPGIFSPDRLSEPGAVAVVGVAGDEIPVHKPKGTTLAPYTLWGELAFQLGGETLYREVESDADSYAAPDKRYFERIFADRRVLILLDELAQYATRLNAARPDGAEQLAAFLMSLLGYARNHAGIAVVITLAGRTDAFAGQTERLARLLAEIRGEAVSSEEAGRMAETAQRHGGSVIARDDASWSEELLAERRAEAARE